MICNQLGELNYSYTSVIELAVYGLLSYRDELLFTLNGLANFLIFSCYAKSTLISLPICKTPLPSLPIIVT